MASVSLIVALAASVVALILLVVGAPQYWYYIYSHDGNDKATIWEDVEGIHRQKGDPDQSDRDTDDEDWDEYSNDHDDRDEMEQMYAAIASFSIISIIVTAAFVALILLFLLPTKKLLEKCAMICIIFLVLVGAAATVLTCITFFILLRRPAAENHDAWDGDCPQEDDDDYEELPCNTFVGDNKFGSTKVEWGPTTAWIMYVVAAGMNVVAVSGVLSGIRASRKLTLG